MATKIAAFQKCINPDCGAQLVVNLDGHRRFTCGREDVYGADDAGRQCRVIAVTAPCRTSEIAARMKAAEAHKLN